MSKKTWKCYYCKKTFESMFDRDRIHHPTHIEHWKRLWESSKEQIVKLEKEYAEEIERAELLEDFSKMVRQLKYIKWLMILLIVIIIVYLGRGM